MSEFITNTNHTDLSQTGGYMSSGMGTELVNGHSLPSTNEIPEVRMVDSRDLFEASAVWVEQLEIDRVRFGQFAVQVYNRT